MPTEMELLIIISISNALISFIFQMEIMVTALFFINIEYWELYCRVKISSSGRRIFFLKYMLLKL